MEGSVCNGTGYFFGYPPGSEFTGHTFAEQSDLTPEEKEYRRKLRNRISAQRSRENKKAEHAALERAAETAQSCVERLLRMRDDMDHHYKSLMEKVNRSRLPVFHEASAGTGTFMPQFNKTAESRKSAQFPNQNVDDWVTSVLNLPEISSAGEAQIRRADNFNGALFGGPLPF